MLININDPKALPEVMPRKHAMEEFGMGLMGEGVISLAGSRFYVTMAHTEEIIDDTISRFENVMSQSEAAN